MPAHTPCPALASSADIATRPPAPMEPRPWTLDRIGAALSGTVDLAAVREVDRLGLSVPTYAAMQRALAADSLLKLLDQPEGASQGQRIIELLMAIGEAQVRTEQRLSVTEAALVSFGVRSGVRHPDGDLRPDRLATRRGSRPQSWRIPFTGSRRLETCLPTASNGVPDGSRRSFAGTTIPNDCRCRWGLGCKARTDR